ncbi:peptidyl-prolyl cis-trans isomerase [Microcoleus sp. POL10_C6]|uniref:peptidyl-prolyl cis-trans isomerase n=1 Tax=Microcoleus sp. POL10_C6 TaxID=2818852 RepID=UPI002FD68BB4
MQSTLLPATQTMENLIFVTINDQPLSLQASLQHLKKAGKLNTVLLEIAQQNLLEREIQAREIPEPTAEMVEQFLLEFRLQQKLTSPESFQLWLLKNGTTYSEFKQQVSFRIQQEELKASITADEVQNYFDQRKADLERVVFSRIVVESVDSARNLKEKAEQGADFNQLAKEHSIVDDAIVGGVMAPIIRSQMPEVIREAMRSAQPGQLVGPLQIEQRYCLLRVEQCLPASLDGSLKCEIEEQIFQQWLTEKLQQVSIKLNIPEPSVNS